MTLQRDELGGFIEERRHVRDLLNGMPEIEEYSGFSAKTIKDLSSGAEPFPLALVAGRWISSRLMVDAWARRMILKSCQVESDGQIPAKPGILQHPASRRKNGV